MTNINPSTTKSHPKSALLSRVDTLIITVGTRQVGWHCKDNVVRCLGADGDRGNPPHIEELYQELGIKRDYHQADDPNSHYGVRHLGEQFYHYCKDSPQDRIDKIQLLLDQNIITDSVQSGLKQIILWGTNQPNTVPWTFRRFDTLWLAKLIALKLRAELPDSIKIDVLQPELEATKSELIRQELEANILPLALQFLQETDHQFVIAIENTGCVPAIAQSLEICVAALVRQCQVLNVCPEVPNPLYQDLGNGKKTAQTSYKYDIISVGDYFWPLERLRVNSAWERGDFREAEIWLTSHQRRYKGLLYQLAGKLALSTNWEIYHFLKDKERGIEGWLRLETLRNFAGSEQIEAWLKQLQTTRTNNFAIAWESSFLIYLQLTRSNYTSAFMQFAQTLERLLSIYAKEDDWKTKGLLKKKNNFYSLINARCELNKPHDNSQNSQLLHSIREKRNDIVHSAEPLTPEEVKAVWSNNGLLSESLTGDDRNGIMQLMSQTLELVSNPDWELPSKTLLRSLYDWGLDLLQSESK